MIMYIYFDVYILVKQDYIFWEIIAIFSQNIQTMMSWWEELKKKIKTNKYKCKWKKASSAVLMVEIELFN